MNRFKINNGHYSKIYLCICLGTKDNNTKKSIDIQVVLQHKGRPYIDAIPQTGSNVWNKTELNALLYAILRKVQQAVEFQLDRLL